MRSSREGIERAACRGLGIENASISSSQCSYQRTSPVETPINKHAILSLAMACQMPIHNFGIEIIQRSKVPAKARSYHSMPYSRGTLLGT
jgi:hypothetical protein